MKRVARAAAIAAIATLGSLPCVSFAQQSPHQDHRVAIVDVSYLLERLPAIREHKRQVRAERKKNDIKREKKRALLQQAAAQLKMLPKGSPEYANQENRVAELDSGLRLPRIYHDTSPSEAETQLYLDGYRQIRSAVKAVALEHGVHLVLNVERGEKQLRQSDVNSIAVMRNVVFHENTVDITHKVLRTVLRDATDP